MRRIISGRLIQAASCRYKPIRLVMDLWLPGMDASSKLIEALKGKANNGDILVVSEKALSVSKGLVVDEASIKPSILSMVITLLLMRIVWGYLLGPLCRLKPYTLEWLRAYPLREGSRHKQLAAKLGGLLEVLKPSSEAGVDASNLPGSLVALPLFNPLREAEELRSKIKKCLGINVTVVISDSDRLYIHRSSGFALTSRRSALKRSLYLGFLAYIIGRTFRGKFAPFATPLAVVGEQLDSFMLLGLTELADRLRGSGAGRTVFEMAERFEVGLEEVTWRMLSSIKHCPAVLFKPR